MWLIYLLYSFEMQYTNKAAKPFYFKQYQFRFKQGCQTSLFKAETW